MRFSSHKAPAREEPFIPGLPDDIGLQCILRVPVDKHESCKAVCKRWHAIFGSKEQFFGRRKQLGIRELWLFISVYNDRIDQAVWKVLDLTRLSWHTIPCMPRNDKVHPNGFGCVSIPHEGALFVCGGYDAYANTVSNSVFKYEILKDRWTLMENMMTERMHFGSEVIDGMIYVVGGLSAWFADLTSAEVLDPETGSWRSISNMPTNIGRYCGVLDGKFYVTEGRSFSGMPPRGQVYDPVMNQWKNMALGLRRGWTGLGVVVCGHLFVLTKCGRTKLDVYDVETDSWDVVKGTSMPENICAPCHVSCWECKIYVTS